MDNFRQQQYLKDDHQSSFSMTPGKETDNIMGTAQKP
jgi:hypothetical protein